MRIGLVAGEGKLPIVFAKAAKARGDIVIAFALKGVADEALAGCVDKIHWLEWGGLKKGLLLLAMERIGHIVLLGKIKKELRKYMTQGELIGKKGKDLVSIPLPLSLRRWRHLPSGIRRRATLEGASVMRSGTPTADRGGNAKGAAKAGEATLLQCASFSFPSAATSLAGSSGGAAGGQNTG